MTRNHGDLSAGVRYGDRSLFVRAVDPALTEALEEARAAYHQNECSWQKKIANYQINSGMARRRLESAVRVALQSLPGRRASFRPAAPLGRGSFLASKPTRVGYACFESSRTRN